MLRAAAFRMARRIRLVLFSLIACTSGPGWIAPLRADTATLGASKDNTLYESGTGTASNGAGNAFFAGRTGETPGISIRRGLLAFDIAGQIPAGATITDVQLTLRMSRTTSGSQNVTLHRVLADWGEGASVATGGLGGGGSSSSAATNDATWLHRFFPGTTWTTAGGDFVATPSATLAVGSIASYTWSGAGLVADVQAWLDGTAGNFGWLVRGNEGSTKTAKRFDSRDNPSPAVRPQLRVTYSTTAVENITWSAVKGLYHAP